MGANEDLEQLGSAIRVISDQYSSDPNYASELKSGEVEKLQAAGVSAALIAKLLLDAGAEEEEVMAYGLGDIMPSPTDPGSTELIWNDHCIGTCRRITLVIKTSSSTSQWCPKK